MGGADKQILSPDLTFEYAVGREENSWYQEFNIQLKVLATPIVANPNDPTDGIIYLKFPTWRNPPCTKKLDGFKISIVEKISVT